MDKNRKSKNVCVVVLGDIGRSPRMQYHALSIAEMGHTVDIIGYGDTEPMDEVKEEPLLFYHYMVPCPQVPIRIINYAFKTIWQAINLLFLLMIGRKPNVLIVQNPPAIPALVVCWIFCRIVSCKFIVDWHNYGHTILALNLSKNHKLVQITEKVETFVGQKADHNFCVTNAMRNDLNNRFKIKATTLYDKPPLIFKTITLEEKHMFLLKFGKTYKNVLFHDGSTLFTEIKEGKVTLKNPRPGILVSSTSWTEDEDFSVLFTALQDYENHFHNDNIRKLPNLFCIITGKGPMKEYYLEKIANQSWQHVFIIAPWLESKDYPLMLASADLGVCLHTSSSGLDLPMKVVDMFGCGLPVCAYKFNCLDELVQHGKNGYHFSSSQELSQQLQNWFSNYPNNDQQIENWTKFKTELQRFQTFRWKENWQSNASSVFK